jgi:hypothetical protein
MGDPSDRKNPPKPEEWEHIWAGVKKAHDGWVIVGPLVAIIKNWKAWAIGAGFFIWINRPDVIALVGSIFGAGQ